MERLRGELDKLKINTGVQLSISLVPYDNTTCTDTRELPMWWYHIEVSLFVGYVNKDMSNVWMVGTENTGRGKHEVTGQV